MLNNWNNCPMKRRLSEDEELPSILPIAASVKRPQSRASGQTIPSSLYLKQQCLVIELVSGKSIWMPLVLTALKSSSLAKFTVIDPAFVEKSPYRSPLRLTIPYSKVAEELMIFAFPSKDYYEKPHHLQTKTSALFWQLLSK